MSKFVRDDTVDAYCVICLTSTLRSASFSGEKACFLALAVRICTPRSLYTSDKMDAAIPTAQNLYALRVILANASLSRTRMRAEWSFIRYDQLKLLCKSDTLTQAILSLSRYRAYPSCLMMVVNLRIGSAMISALTTACRCSNVLPKRITGGDRCLISQGSPGILTRHPHLCAQRPETT